MTQTRSGGHVQRQFDQFENASHSSFRPRLLPVFSSATSDPHNCSTRFAVLDLWNLSVSVNTPGGLFFGVKTQDLTTNAALKPEDVLPL